MKKILVSSIFTLLLSAVIFAQSGLEGVWYNTSKSGKIKIYKQGDEYFGKIVWLEDPLDENGNPKVNENSPEEAEQDDPIIGLVILKNFEDKGDGSFKGGTIYDPENGKTYSCKMKLDDDALEVRGYVGISLLGRTENWTRTK